MNDKVFFNLEQEISKNYLQMNHKNESNIQLEIDQKDIIKNIQIMMNIVEKEQFQFQNNLHKQSNHQNGQNQIDQGEDKSQSNCN